MVNIKMQILRGLKAPKKSVHSDIGGDQQLIWNCFRVQKIIGGHCEMFYANKCGNLDARDDF